MIFCDEILSEATEVTSSGMTVVGGGLNADGGLIEFFADTSSTANAVPLPPLGKARVCGAEKFGFPLVGRWLAAAEKWR